MATRNQTWQCISHCGACCRLAPNERIEALEALTAKQTSQYLDLVDQDGWCRFFDKSKKRCTIYEQRPDFCNVKYLLEIFKPQESSLDSFAISSCKQHIRSIYGGRSNVLKRFQFALRSKAK